MKSIKEVQKYIHQIKHIFLIDQFKLQIVDSKVPEKREENTACNVDVRYDYLDISIIVFPVFYTLKDTEQKETIVHELSHSITLLQAHLIDLLLDGKLVTQEQAREVLERENSWIERILCTHLKEQLKL